MKLLDEIRITSDKYEPQGVLKGAIGTIMLAEIRDNTFEVVFSDETGWDYATVQVFVGDMELVRDIGVSDECILDSLPGRHPEWWCKVEDGFILNLKGEKKNKVAYQYK